MLTSGSQKALDLVIFLTVAHDTKMPGKHSGKCDIPTTGYPGSAVGLFHVSFIWNSGAPTSYVTLSFLKKKNKRTGGNVQ